MTQPTNTTAGNRFNFFGFIDPDGFLIGSTPTRPAAGTSTLGGMRRIIAPKKATPTTPQPDSVVSTGEDGEVLHDYQFRSIATRGFMIEIAAQDLATEAVVQNMPLSIAAGASYTYEDIADVVLPDVCGLFQSRARRVDNGGNIWGGVFVGRASLSIMGRDQFNERTPGLFRYWATPQPTNYDFLSFTILDLNGTQKQARYVPFTNLPHPVTMHAFTGDGIVTQFPVDFPPVNVTPLSGYSAASAEHTNRAIASVVASTPYSISLAAAPALNYRGNLFYQIANA